MVADPVGQGVQLLLAGHVELKHGRWVGQPLGDPLDEGEPAKPRQHNGRAFLLGYPGHVKGDR